MQYVVIIATLRNPNDKRGHIQYLECQNAREASRIADALADVMNDTSTKVGLKFWKQDGGSVILDQWQVNAIAEFHLDGGDSTGKPSFANAAE